MTKVEIINNPRTTKDVVEFSSKKRAFNYIHEKILADDQCIDWFEAQDWGDPYELDLETFEAEFGNSISVGDYTYHTLEFKGEKQ